MSAPGTGTEGTPDDSSRSGPASVVDRLDDRVDRLFEPLRGNPTVDTAAKVITGIGDHGWLWTGVAMWRGRR